MISVSPNTRLYSDCDGHGPGKTLGQLTDERVFVVVKHKPGHAKPYLIAGKYTSQLGWVSIWFLLWILLNYKTNKYFIK